MTDAFSEAPTFGIAKILHDGKFLVPSHQRDYSWTTDEVQQLFDDVADAMKKKDDSYFLGLLVFLTNDSRLTVLDGQQRLATISIIFAAIRDWLRQYPEFLGEAAKIQDRYIGASELGETEPTPRLVMNQANNTQFVNFVVKGASTSDIIAAQKKFKRNDPNHNLIEVILYARERIEKIAAEIGNQQKAAKYFFDLIKFYTEHIRTVRLNVADENSAYTLFETLNDRGIDLSPLDLVKNFLFKKAAGQSQQTLNDIQTRWIQMISTLSNVKAASFLKTFWTSRHGRIRTNLLFETFRKEYSVASKAIALSSDLVSAAEKYAALESADDPVWSSLSKEARQSVASLKLLGSQQTHPIILSALEKFSVSEIQKLLRLLEVTIVRFLLVVGGNPGRFEPTCARIAELIYNGTLKNTASCFIELKAAEVYPNDDEFEAAFRVKSERNNQKAQYFLKALEMEEQRLKKGKMANEWAPTALTVEHILPKKPGQDWQATLKADPDLLDECVLRLGNLCLLTDINSKLGNKGFAAKKTVFKKSELLTTKALAKNNKWDRSAIDKRQANFAKLAKSVWKFP